MEIEAAGQSSTADKEKTQRILPPPARQFCDFQLHFDQTIALNVKIMAFFFKCVCRSMQQKGGLPYGRAPFYASRRFAASAASLFRKGSRGRRYS